MLAQGIITSLIVLGFCLGCTGDRPKKLITLDSKQAPQDSLINPIQYLLFGSSNPSTIDTDSFSINEYHLLKEGDIILRRGFGNISDFIADFLDEEYPVTHAGLLVKPNNKPAEVWHTSATEDHNGTIAQPLEVFCNNSQAGSLIVVRLKNNLHAPALSVQKAQQIMLQNRPFDFRFDHCSDDKLYCLEFLRNCYLDAYQYDYFPKIKTAQGIEVLQMDNFFNSNNFDCIINHYDSSLIIQD